MRKEQSWIRNTYPSTFAFAVIPELFGQVFHLRSSNTVMNHISHTFSLKWHPLSLLQPCGSIENTNSYRSIYVMWEIFHTGIVRNLVKIKYTTLAKINYTIHTNSRGEGTTWECMYSTLVRDLMGKHVQVSKKRGKMVIIQSMR